MNDKGYLEQALDKIENILNGVGEMSCYSKSMCLYEEDIEDILDIIKKAKEENKQLQQENKQFKERLNKALKMIWENYGVLDKYGIELLEDTLKGV